jgi:hypothetical protein
METLIDELLPAVAVATPTVVEFREYVTVTWI